jgi:hypothetical protein
MTQELRTGLTCHLLDEGPNRLVNEVSFEFIPGGDQATGAPFLQLKEGAQGAKDRIVNGPLPAHDKSLRMVLVEGFADLLAYVIWKWTNSSSGKP